MNISKITIEQILKARDERAEKQRRFISKYKLPLVCFTMNIAGEIKNSPLIEFAFMCGTHMLDEMPFNIKYKETEIKDTGCCAYYVVDGKAQEIKNYTEKSETSFPAARLFDMDVLDINHNKLSRKESRKCLLCSENAAVCARSRAHSLEKTEQKTNELLSAFAAQKLAEYACFALLAEVETTPKAGLVDLNNCGAHKDMDLETFKKSACALKPYFEKFALLGLENANVQELKKTGAEAEKAMFSATENVNTHKGLIYSFALLLFDAGRILNGEASNFKKIAALDAQTAFKAAQKNPLTHGEMQYKNMGVLGIRGEAMAGFPHAFSAAEVLADFKTRFSENDAQALTLVHIMQTLEDTNVLHRGGREMLEFMQSEAKKIISLDETERIFAIKQLDLEFIKKNISPGGCADTLALAIFVDLLRKKHYYLLHTFLRGDE